jgi:hypothetical protein
MSARTGLANPVLRVRSITSFLTRTAPAQLG